MKNFRAHIPCAKAQIFFGTSFQYLFTDSKKFIFVRNQNSGIIISQITANIPHIVVHDPIIIRIIAVSLDDNLTSFFVIPMLSIQSNYLVKAYRDYPNDYWIMHYYMWNIGGDLADNDPAVLIAHKDEFLAICEKILEGCTEENLRLGAWNMRAKILHAEGKTDEALEIYKTKFTDWFTTSGQKTEQLFAKDTSEYYFHVQKNMYELVDFAADKLGRTVFFNPSLSMEEKAKRALQYGDLMLNAFEETGEAFFLMLARSFLGRMENDFNYRGGTDEQVTSIMDKNLFVTKKTEDVRMKNEALSRAFDRYGEAISANFFKYNLDYRTNAKSGRRAELLKNSEYRAVLDKYR